MQAMINSLIIQKPLEWTTLHFTSVLMYLKLYGDREGIFSVHFMTKCHGHEIILSRYVVATQCELMA